MPQYKLTYFNSRGLAEVARMLFAVADQDYEDYRLKEGEWDTLKSKSPSGQAPVLEADGQTLSQSKAIGRYLAEKFGLAGKTDWDKAKADMIVDCVEDMIKHLAAIHFETNETEKAEKKKKYQEEQMPTCLANFEKFLDASGTGFFVGDEMTWADITFSHGVTFPSIAGITVDWGKYPKCKALKDKVEAQPKIAAWIQKRPESQF